MHSVAIESLKFSIFYSNFETQLVFFLIPNSPFEMRFKTNPFKIKFFKNKFLKTNFNPNFSMDCYFIISKIWGEPKPNPDANPEPKL